MRENDEQNEEFNFSDMIFDVACGNCGEVIFSLPYKLDTVHSMKCYKCGETNIIEVDEKGGIGHMLKPELDKIINNFKTNELGKIKFRCSGEDRSFDCENSGTINNNHFNLQKFEVNGFKVKYRVVCKNAGIKHQCIKNSFYQTESISLKNYVTKD